MIKRRVWYVLFHQEVSAGMPVARLFSSCAAAKEVAEELTADFGGLEEHPEVLGTEEVEFDD
jgi:hypothetical protein